MSKTLEKHLRMTRDVVSGLPDTVALKIFEKLPIQDLLRCRHVSKKWHSLAATPDLWRSHALALTEADPVKVSPPSEPQGWEPLVKNLFFRERNWAKGLAQSIQTLEGHTGFVTAMKLKGRKTLVSGSYDETIRGQSPRTISEYYLDLRMFFRFMKLIKQDMPYNTPLEEISIRDVDLNFIKKTARPWTC